MTHSTKFDLNEELGKAFTEHSVSTDKSVRTLQIQIVDEAFVLSKEVPYTEDLSADFQASVALVEADKASYLVMKTGTGSAPWNLVSFVPDSAVVRDKMMYASGRDALKKALGGSLFGPDMHVTHMEDLTFAEFEQSMKGGTQEASDDVKTGAEITAEMEELKIAAESAVAAKTSGSLMSFPTSDEASAKLQSFQEGAVAFVALQVVNEKVELHSSEASVDGDSVAGKMSDETPTFCLFRWDHTHKDESTSAVFFIYCCPESCAIKLKMTHASCKAAVLDSVAKMGITVTKSMEITESKEMEGTEFLRKEMYPDEVASQPAMVSKPKARGGRRLVKKDT